MSTLIPDGQFLFLSAYLTFIPLLFSKNAVSVISYLSNNEYETLKHRFC